MGDYEVFVNQSFWSAYGTTPDYLERIAVINSLIPHGDIGLLDVGCGKGDVINGLIHFRPDIRPVGVDPFFGASQTLNFPFTNARLPHIPFTNKSFEMVICLQVLEHLNLQDYSYSLLEIQRLSSNHVIIGVPYKENLDTLTVLCSNCGTKSHAYGHLRSFLKCDMTNLLSDFDLQELILTGVNQRRNSKLGIIFEQKLANLYHIPEHFVCPSCQGISPSVSKGPNIIRITARIVNKILMQFSPKLPYWMIAHYCRKGYTEQL
jgi:hypothetical protein